MTDLSVNPYITRKASVSTKSVTLAKLVIIEEERTRVGVRSRPYVPVSTGFRSTTFSSRNAQGLDLTKSSMYTCQKKKFEFFSVPTSLKVQTLTKLIKTVKV